MLRKEQEHRQAIEMLCTDMLTPQNHVLSYSTTNREGYREYKSKSYICRNCPV